LKKRFFGRGTSAIRMSSPNSSARSRLLVKLLRLLKRMR
jgi:hypothetical protein